MDPVRSLARKGELHEDLARLFQTLSTRAPSVVVTRRRVPAVEGREFGGRESSAHLVRLWAHEEALRLCRTAEPRSREQAAKLGSHYRLVTPVTGAVVLETKEQYERAGLELPDDLAPSESPGGSFFSHGAEPEWLLLLAVVLLVLGFELYKRGFRSAV